MNDVPRSVTPEVAGSSPASRQSSAHLTSNGVREHSMAKAADGVKVAVLDDYQNVGRTFADWSNLAPRAQAVFFHDHVADLDQLAARLANFEILMLMRERTGPGGGRSLPPARQHKI